MKKYLKWVYPAILCLPAIGSWANQFEDVSSLIETHSNPSLINSRDGQSGLAWFDYNNDQWPDLFITSGKGGANALFRNNGDGTFTDVAASAGVASTQGSTAVVAADFDNDGCRDLIVTGDGSGIFVPTRLTFEQSPLQVYRNQCNGTFEEVTIATTIDAPETSGAIAVADINNDSFLDIFIASPGSIVLGEQHATRMYLNNGDWTFTDVSTSSGVSSALGACASGFSDVDRDGDQDLYVANCASIQILPPPIELFLNDGNGVFTNATNASGIGLDLGCWMSATRCDFNNNGQIDFFAANGGSLFSFPNTVYLNQNGDFTSSPLLGDNVAPNFGW